MKIGRIEIRATRFPWQGYGWFPHKNGKGDKAPLNPYGSRFGAGWTYKLGLSIGGSTILLDLLFGTVRIVLHSKDTQP